MQSAVKFQPDPDIGRGGAEGVDTGAIMHRRKHPCPAQRRQIGGNRRRKQQHPRLWPSSAQSQRVRCRSGSHRFFSPFGRSAPRALETIETTLSLDTESARMTEDIVNGAGDGVLPQVGPTERVFTAITGSPENVRP